MKKLKKFYEVYYDKKSMEEEYDVMDDSVVDVEKGLMQLKSGEKTQLEMDGFEISLPSELDGKYFLLVNQQNKHVKIKSEPMNSAVMQIEDYISGKKVMESRKPR